MAKKSKTLEAKLRSAIRLIWSRSAERRAIIKAATIDDPENGKGFICPLCERAWPIWAGEVDHDPAIGSLERWQDVAEFIQKMFFGPQRVVCKACHKKRTAEQRRKK
jgi:hypothetical protein